MTTQPKYRLHHSVGYLLSVTSRQQERRLEDSLKELGLTRITWCVLLAVGNEELVHPSEIAEFVGIDRTAMSRALRQMEAAGMVARTSGGDDRRMTAVQLTDKGHDLLQQGTPSAVGNNAVIEGSLSAAELAELRKILHKLRGTDDVPLNRL